MKKIFNPFFFTVILFAFMAVAQVSMAQPPRPPASGESGNQGEGHSGPIDGGVLVSLAMIAGYGSWKLFKFVQERKKAV